MLILILTLALGFFLDVVVGIDQWMVISVSIGAVGILTLWGFFKKFKNTEDTEDAEDTEDTEDNL
ncbi:MAG: hypothetical protein FWG85_01055 [Bacteroidetes bacterium]|nr:hypothetical protein [Bacteroidota bacterium]